jgi:hypothetical protein
MDTNLLKKYKWFLPWQDEKEEAWLEEMSLTGWHLKSVQLPCVYFFCKGESSHNIYRLDYMLLNKSKLPEYLQVFQDAGWEYIGEMSNWQYWRKHVVSGEIPEIFTDNESKIKKYRRILAIMAFFLIFLTFMGTNLFMNKAWTEPGYLTLINGIYRFALLLYAVIIPIYVVVVVQLLRRINQLKKKII